MTAKSIYSLILSSTAVIKVVVLSVLFIMPWCKSFNKIEIERK